MFLKRKTTSSWCVAICLTATVVSGCNPESPPEDFREPRCEARSTTEPGRINIDTSAENYGLKTPCESSFKVYISKNTDLRSIDGTVKAIGEDGGILDEYSFDAELNATDFGMLQKQITLKPVDGHICRSLKFSITSLNCYNGEGDRIKCPNVRLKTSMVFEDMTIDDKDPNICYDD